MRLVERRLAPATTFAAWAATSAARDLRVRLGDVEVGLRHQPLAR